MWRRVHGRRSCAAALAWGAVTIATTCPGAAETMESALAEAYQNNPQLNAQRAIVRQTDEGVPQALSGYRPTISANVSIGREYTDTKQQIPPLPPNLPNGVSFEAKGLS